MNTTIDTLAQPNTQLAKQLPKTNETSATRISPAITPSVKLSDVKWEHVGGGGNPVLFDI
jgi:hypothetical protein